MRIKIKALGIHGLAATDENPSGEYPIGHEMDVDHVPPGWVEKVEVLSGKPHKDAKLVTGASEEPNGEVGNDPDNLNDTPRRGRPPKGE